MKKTYNSSGGLIETVYYWSQNFVTVVNSSGSYNFTYVYHNGDLVAQQNPDGSKLFVLGDNKGSTSVITNGSGAVLERTTYSPTGEVLSGGRLNRYGYEAKEQELGFGKVPTNGLVSYYSFEGGAFDEGVGNQGTITNATLTTGKVRDAYSFSGSSYVQVNDSNSLDLTGNITLSAWIYPRSVTQGYIVCKYGAYMIQFLTTNQTQGGIWSGSSWKAFVSGTTNLNTWSHVVFTYDKVTARLYVNGASVANFSNTSAIDVNANYLYIGAKNSTDRTRDFNGSVDEVGIWNRALTASEVTDLYNYGNQFDSGFRSTDFNSRRFNLNTVLAEQPDTQIRPYNPQSLNRYMVELGNPLKNKDETGHFSEITGRFRWLQNNVDYLSDSINEAYQQTIDSVDPTLRFVGKGMYSASLGVYDASARWFINEMFWQQSKNSQIKLFGPQTQGEMNSLRVSAALSVGSQLVGNYLTEVKNIPGYAQLDDTLQFLTGGGVLDWGYKVVTGMGAFVDKWLTLNPGKENELKQALSESAKRHSSGSSSGSYYICTVKVTPQKTSSYENIRRLLGQS